MNFKSQKEPITPLFGSKTLSLTIALSTPAIQQILTAYAEQGRETRTDPGVAPLIEVAETTTTSRPDTPLDGIDTDNTSSTDTSAVETIDEEASVSEIVSESQTRQNTNYNTIISVIENLTLDDPQTAIASTSTARPVQVSQTERKGTEDPYDNDDFFELLGSTPLRNPRPSSPFRALTSPLPVNNQASRYPFRDPFDNQ